MAIAAELKTRREAPTAARASGVALVSYDNPARCRFAAQAPAAVDGTETAVAVLWGAADASAGNATAAAVVRGPAIVNRNDLVFAGTPTDPEIAAAHADLAAAGILVR